MKPLVSVAPMMDWTDRHCRYFHRLLSPHAWLYTEMVTTGALLHGKHHQHLRYSPQEHPVVLQLGGSDPAALAASAKMGADYGYDEINLNCGCPSDRVQQGKFGACLMAEPELVADGVAAMAAAVDIPITIKCRIGIDDTEDYEFLESFVTKVAPAGCRTFIIHARKAWLKGLSPKENREVPPLKYDVVARLKAARPDLCIILNGGLKTTAQVSEALQTFDGVMIGREAYQNPVVAWRNWKPISMARPCPIVMPSPGLWRSTVLRSRTRDGTPVHSVTRHMLGLYNGLRGARHWRRQVGGASFAAKDAASLIEEALVAIDSYRDMELAA